MSPGKKDEKDEEKMIEATESKPGGSPDKRAQTETVLSDILKLMGYPAKLDFKDAPDGGISVAMHFEVGEVPFAAAGKRSFVIDSMQFLVNKVVNRPNTERRWVSLGVGEHPAPRPPRSTPVPGMTPVPGNTPAPMASPAPKNGMQAASQRGHGPAHSPPPPARTAHADEAALEVKADPKIAALGTALAEKAARLGRPLGVMSMDADDRARMLKAAQAVKGQSARVEGEGHNRRLVFAPDKPVPMPKKSQFPVFDDEEDTDE